MKRARERKREMRLTRSSFADFLLSLSWKEWCPFRDLGSRPRLRLGCSSNCFAYWFLTNLVAWINWLLICNIRSFECTCLRKAFWDDAPGADRALWCQYCRPWNSAFPQGSYKTASISELLSGCKSTFYSVFNYYITWYIVIAKLDVNQSIRSQFVDHFKTVLNVENEIWLEILEKSVNLFLPVSVYFKITIGVDANHSLKITN